MATLLEQLDFLAPGLAAVSAEDKTTALSVAEAFRPECLSAAAQDQAQLYYAIWLLFSRLQQTDSGVAAPMPGVKAIKEGDVTITYSDGADATSGVYDPDGFYARWVELNDLCGRGAITVGTFARRVPNGCC